MVGVPVIINHKDLTAKNADDLRVGVVNSVWYDKNDGWYWCDGIIWDETAQNLITDKNWSVSCSYDVKLADDKGGSENNIKYDMEFFARRITGILLVVLSFCIVGVNIMSAVKDRGTAFHELALVSNPRYERANIVFNSKTEILNDKWVTVHPNGEDEEGRPLLIKDGENLKEAMQRQWGLYEKRQAKLKSDTKEEDKKEDFDDAIGAKSLKDNEAVKRGLDEETAKKQIEKLKKGKEYRINKSARLAFTGDYDNEGMPIFEDNKGNKQGYSLTNLFEEIDEEPKESKQTEPQEEKNEVKAKEEAYKKAWDDYNENEKKIRASELFSPDFMKYANRQRVASLKKAITDSRREYAESIMANFEHSDNTYYEDKQAARRERYEELADKASRESSQAHQAFRDKMSVIPGGQPIHGARDARYREKAWDTLGKAVKLSDKADYYERKAGSVGTAGISADDANAIEKLARKYKSGSITSAEKRRIIDRVIDIHKGMQAAGDTSKQTDYSELGFQVERNTDINRLQLKFDGKPDENTRSILKSNGFRWSPREMAWQRQLGGNSESGLNRVIEGLKKVNNSLLVGLDEIFSSLDIQTEQDANLYEEINHLLVSNSINNEKEQDMALLEELKNLISRVQNNKGAEMTSKERILSILNAADVDEDVKKEVENEIEEIEKEKLEDKEEIENKKKVKNEKVDKRDIIRQIMAIAGKNEDNEEVRTIAKLAEKLAYDESEAGTADNKKVKNEDEEDKKEVKEVKEDVKKDVENKCKNSVDNSKVDYFEKMNEIYNSVQKAKEENLYISQAEREKAAEEYFKK